LNDSSIDVSRIDLRKFTEKPFPPSRRYRILVSGKAHDAIWKHAQDTQQERKEVGGVLVGNVYKDEQGPFLEITGAIVGEHTRNEGTQVTFTHETWQQVNKTREKKYPKDRIVGWYHTHPNFGVFLSDMDVFIQKNFFSEPWQTAFVLDPVRQTEGFFIWARGEPKLIDEYWIEQERRDRSLAKVPINSDSEDESADSGAPEKPGYATAVSRAAFALVVALGFLALLFLSGYIYLREVAHSQAENGITNVVHQQQIALLESMQLMDDLKQRFEKSEAQNKTKDDNASKEIEAIQQRLAAANVMTEMVRSELASQHRVIERLRRELSAPANEAQTPAKPSQ
jgi:proteasome lid subunit RPN8/RPN11/polyhydroxyalkanoate synthesis regulator phasin